MKKISYCKRLDATRESKLAKLDHLTPQEFDDLRKSARELFNAQDVQVIDGRKNFDESTAFISSSDALNGFYVCGANLQNRDTARRLHLIAFDRVKHYDLKNHQKLADTFKPVAIYIDGREDLYTAESVEIDLTQLHNWQREIQRDINEASARVSLWAMVTRNYKKDGSAFANVQKNFNNAKVEQSDDALEITVGGVINSHYIDDVLYCCDKYPLNNVDDVLPSIQKRIELLNDYIKREEQLLKHSEVIYLDIVGAFYEKVLKYQTPSNDIDINEPHLYYTFREIIRALHL